MAYRIPEETKRAIIEAARIDEVVGEFVSLKKRGANYLGLCPFHQEKTPSFIVSPAKGIFKCFGCGKGGDSVSFLMEHEHFDYVEALRYLAQKYNIEIKAQELTPEQAKAENDRESLYHVTQHAAEYFVKNLWESEQGRTIGLSYFRERRFTDAIIKQFQLGYCTDSWDAFTQEALKAGYDKKFLVQSGLTIEKEENGKLYDRFRGRVIFPIHSLSGRVLGFGGRILTSDKTKAKYVNSPESDIYHKSNVLYAIPFAKREIVAQDMAYMVEGYADVISMHQAGITNVVASSGTSLTEDQIKLISHFTKNLTLLYDGDPAGIKASLRGIDMVLAKDMNVRVVLLPDGQDPDDYARTHSTDEIQEYLKANAVDFITFKTRLLLADVGNDPIRRAELIDNILTSISVIPDEIKRAVYIQECSRLLGIAEADLYQKLNRIFRSDFQKQHTRQEAEQLPELPPQAKSEEDVRESEAQALQQTLERELMRLLVNYGRSNTRQTYLNAEGKEEKQVLPVCAYIVMELQQDELSFDDPLKNRLFSIFAGSYDRGEIPAAEDLLLSEEPDLRALVADLSATRFEISKVWESKNIYVHTEQNHGPVLDAAVLQAVQGFRLKRVKDMIEKVAARIKETQDEAELMALLTKKQNLDRVKGMLSGMLRRVVC
ncbi:MAG: DNA primase [Bacteroides sp.]|nr:DNA primase [Bacteroides sp.]MCM1085317.1 DNA primase [Bacteroides sp.]